MQESALPLHLALQYSTPRMYGAVPNVDEAIKKEKEARKNQQVVKVKEIQLSCTIDTHDFETRVNHAHRFLADGNKVKVIVKFKGREMSHLDNGREVIGRFLEACADAGSTDKKPTLEGRSMSVILSPLKN